MITRRRFLKNSMLATTVATGTTLSVAPYARALGANDDIRVAVVGFRGQGGLHLRMLRELSGVRVVAVCDVDQGVLDRELKQAAGRGEHEYNPHPERGRHMAQSDQHETEAQKPRPIVETEDQIHARHRQESEERHSPSRRKEVIDKKSAERHRQHPLE